MEKYLGQMVTKRGIKVKVWRTGWGWLYAERHQDIKKSTGGYKHIVKPYKITKEIEEYFAEKVAEVEAEEA